MLLVLDVLLIVFYYLLLTVLIVYLSLYSVYVTMSISIGLYPNLDLWNANKLHYITLQQCATARCGLHRIPSTIYFTATHFGIMCDFCSGNMFTECNGSHAKNCQ